MTWLWKMRRNNKFHGLLEINLKKIGVQIFVPYKEEYRRVVSSHKGSKNTHVDICDIELDDINNKRRNNLNSNMKQNPPKYYYRNVEEYYD